MMDGTRLDAVARGLARSTSRRAALAGLVGAAAALAASSSLAVKSRKRKGKDKSQDEGGETDVDDVLAPGTQVGGVWEASMEICHYNADTGGFDRMLVSAPELPNYLNAGDTLYIDCCVDGDCTWQPCATPNGCLEGACMYEITAGAPCALSDGVTGVCGKDGLCQSGVPAAQEPTPYSEESAPAPVM